MPRPSEDDACEEMLIDHEAERLDVTQAGINAALPQFAASATRIVSLLRVENPSKARVARAKDELLRAILLSFAAMGNDLKEMVARQTTERVETFAKRSSKRLVVQPITKKRMAERKAAIAAAREVEAKGQA